MVVENSPGNSDLVCGGGFTATPDGLDFRRKDSDLWHLEVARKWADDFLLVYRWRIPSEPNVADGDNSGRPVVTCDLVDLRPNPIQKLMIPMTHLSRSILRFDFTLARSRSRRRTGQRTTRNRPQRCDGSSKTMARQKIDHTQLR